MHQRVINFFHFHRSTETTLFPRPLPPPSVPESTGQKDESDDLCHRISNLIRIVTFMMFRRAWARYPPFPTSVSFVRSSKCWKNGKKRYRPDVIDVWCQLLLSLLSKRLQRQASRSELLAGQRVRPHRVRLPCFPRSFGLEKRKSEKRGTFMELIRTNCHFESTALIRQWRPRDAKVVLPLLANEVET